MTENRYANLLFEHFDKELDNAEKRLRNRIFAHFREINWTSEQYKSLQPIIREELDDLVCFLLNSLDNVGGVLPEKVLGFEIRAYDYDPDGAISSFPIREGAFPDYGDIWNEFLQDKQAKSRDI